MIILQNTTGNTTAGAIFDNNDNTVMLVII